MSASVNRSGLTLEDWAAAAGFKVPTCRPNYCGRLMPVRMFLPAKAVVAWSGDEDPCDWMAMNEKIQVLEQDAKEDGYSSYDSFDDKLSGLEWKDISRALARISAPWGRKDAHFRTRNAHWRAGVQQAWADRRKDVETVRSIMEF